MAKLSKIEYDALKALNPEDLTNEDRKDIIDFERAEAQAPSLDDLDWANEIIKMASKYPSTLGRELKETGDFAKAMNIMDADRAYVATKGSRGMDAYVQKVKRIPDDLIKENQFNFNWKSAYENQPNAEKLRDTEADYDRLKKFIDSKMYDVNDPVNLQKIAYELHMYNPNTMKWSEFINSEQGDEFKKYIKDVEKYQKDKAVEAIFSGEDPAKASYPIIGDVDIPGSQFLVDFGLPVAKEYAKKNYENINGVSDMTGPLAVDFGTNLLMMSNKPAASIAVPTISHAGQVAFNDENPAAAAAGAVVGAAANYGTPRAAMAFTRRLNTPSKLTTSKEVSEAVDKALMTTRNVKDKLNNGQLYATTEGYVSDVRKVIYTDLKKSQLSEKYNKYKVKPISEAKTQDIIPVADYKEYLANKNYLRGKTPKEWKENKAFKEATALDENQKSRLVDEVFSKKEKGTPISEYSFDEIRAMGYNPKESVGSFVARETPNTLRAYLMNALGRDRFANPYLRFPAAVGLDLNKLIDEKKDKDKRKSIKEIFGE